MTCMILAKLSSYDVSGLANDVLNFVWARVIETKYSARAFGQWRLQQLELARSCSECLSSQLSGVQNSSTSWGCLKDETSTFVFKS